MRSSAVLFCAICSLGVHSSSSINPSASKALFVRKENHEDPDPNLDFDSFGFSLNGVDTDFMWLDTVDCSNGAIFSTDPNVCLRHLSALQIHPSSTVLNYGQALFEGLKAFRREDGSIIVFRPHENALRLANGAGRLLLPQIPTSTFLEALDNVVRSNTKFIPPAGKGALYIRPLLFGSEKSLGVKPSNVATFCIYSSPVGNYFKGALKCIKLQAVRGYSRAVRGSGNVKFSGNYAPPFLVQRQVRERGFDEALFLDCVSGEHIEEAGASNFFAVFTKTKTIVTPALETNTVLPGITRSSIIELAQSVLGWKVEERNIKICELKDADEAFCCGTGASITPVGVVNYLAGEFPNEECNSQTNKNDNFEVCFGDGIAPGKITESLYNLLLGIQNGDLDDEDVMKKYSSWIHVVEP